MQRTDDRRPRPRPSADMGQRVVGYPGKARRLCCKAGRGCGQGRGRPVTRVDDSMATAASGEWAIPQVA